MWCLHMGELQTVKAREKQGARSLDLTIPAAVVDEFKVSSGDVFAITIDEGSEELILTYRRVYSTSTWLQTNRNWETGARN